MCRTWGFHCYPFLLQQKFQKNKNGVVEEFKYIDSDRDGFLTIDEIIKEPEKMTALVHFREAPSVSDN